MLLARCVVHVLPLPHPIRNRRPCWPLSSRPGLFSTRVVRVAWLNSIVPPEIVQAQNRLDSHFFRKSLFSAGKRGVFFSRRARFFRFRCPARYIGTTPCLGAGVWTVVPSRSESVVEIRHGPGCQPWTEPGLIDCARIGLMRPFATVRLPRSSSWAIQPTRPRLQFYGREFHERTVHEKSRCMAPVRAATCSGCTRSDCVSASRTR